MRTTRYFEDSRRRRGRIIILDAWIRRVIVHPEALEIQTDGRIRVWATIAEVDRVLRVVLLEDGETVHNAFFDRSFRRGLP